MIIHDENSETQSESPTKSSTSHLPTVAPVHRREPSPGPAPPPSYVAATSMTSSTGGPTSPLLPYQPGNNPRADRIHPQMMGRGYQDHTALAVVEQQRRDIRLRTRKRFCKALCIGILLYLLLMAFIGSTIDFALHTPRNDHGDHHPHVSSSYSKHPHPPSTPAGPNVPPIPNPTDRDTPPGAPPPEGPPWPAPDDGAIIQCSGRDSWSRDPPSVPFFQTPLNDMTVSTGGNNGGLPYTAYNVFTLPANVTEKRIFSRGRHASGSVLLRTREADDEEDLIKIVIQASYRYTEALECNICTLRQEGNRRALGIYTSHDFDGAKDIRFTVTVYFPKSRSTGSAPREMGVFGSFLSWFDYTIATYNEIFFSELRLMTDSDKIHSEGVTAEVLNLDASNAPITGFYNLSEANIGTANSKIDVDLNVFHNNNGRSKASKITIATNNGAIISRNSLYNQGSPTGGNFSFVASTKNAPVNISFATAPVDSLLDIIIGTSNGDSTVHLHPTFEGDITLVTTNGKADIFLSDGIDDPSGRERDRVIAWKQMWRWWVIGWVGWGEKKQAGGLVVTTSNGNHCLYL